MSSPGQVDGEEELQVSLLDVEDIPSVRPLAADGELLERVYNVGDIFMPIHYCFLSLKLSARGEGGEGRRVVAAMCFQEHPNVPALPAAGWSEWAASVYGLRGLGTHNCLWVHLALYAPTHGAAFLRPLLRHAFNERVRARFVLFAIPAGCDAATPFLADCSTLVLPVGYTDPRRVQTLRLCARHDFVTPYRIRRAVEEDNDDLVPLVDAFCDRFVPLYGHYYVAELVTRHPDDERALIVAEHAGAAVAMLCLNARVNLAQLNAVFDLRCYAGFYKPEQRSDAVGVAEAGPAEEEEAPEEESEEEEEEQADGSETHTWEAVLAKHARWGDEAPREESVVEGAPSKSLRIIDSMLERLTRSTLMSEAGSDTGGGSSRASSSSSSSSSSVSDSASSVGVASSSSSVGAARAGRRVPNAFVVEILVARPEHAHSLHQLAMSSFECYPGRDYCLLLVPPSERTPPLKHFVRVQPRLGARYPHELYACHRSQLLATRVDAAGAGDAHHVRRVVAMMRAHPASARALLANYERGVAGAGRVHTFLVRGAGGGGAPVGICQVAHVDEMARVARAHDVQRRVDVAHDSDCHFGHVVACALAPMFQRQLKYVLREVQLKTHFRTLFYALSAADAGEQRVRPLAMLREAMFLVPPRRHAAYAHAQPYALFVSTPRLTMARSVHVNHRIVVVGGSQTALGFLERLAEHAGTRRLVAFHNVVLVSRDGLDDDLPPDGVRDRMRPADALRDHAYYHQIALRWGVHVVAGQLVRIDRHARTVTVRGRIVIPYEYLLLTTGLQYCLPANAPAGAPRAPPGGRPPMGGAPPRNCFTINSRRDAQRALDALYEAVQSHDGDAYEVLVYGDCLDCYCCIGALLEFGVPATSVVHVAPTPAADSHDFVFQDGGVYATVVEAVAELGVRTHRGYALTRTTRDPLAFRFEGFTRALQLRPLAAFVYGDKCIDIDTFHAIRDCGLVFDGRLVIGADFGTNDAHIFAAGPLTKYRRRLHAAHMAHACFNSHEVGVALACRVRALVLPDDAEEAAPSRLGVPEFSQPVMCSARLPGGLHYLHVRKAGHVVPVEVAMSDAEYGVVLTTGACEQLDAGPGYFRLHLNAFHSIETITCLSRTPFDERKLSLLWGKHEALLNNLLSRHRAALIPDLFDYFQQPWTAAIFLDDFDQLHTAVMQVMLSLTDKAGQSPIEDLHAMYAANGFQPLTKEQRRAVSKRFSGSGFERRIETLILNYIRDNLGVLDMYAHPVLIHQILSNYESSPLFTKRTL